MWFLKNKESGLLYYLKPKSESVVGKNFGDLTFQNDKSVSRKHATIYGETTGVTVQDHSSKYGTYINEGISQKKRIDPEKKIPLGANDSIRFGLLGNEWKLLKEDFMTCLSTIKDEDFTTIKEQLNELGISISKEWTSKCTHLTMPSITLTLKVVLALVHQMAIVKPDFWTECLLSRNNNLPLPDADKYLPEVKEATISQHQDSFKMNPRRATLFAGKRVIFLSRHQMKSYEQIIKGAGGECSYLGGGGITNGQLCSPHSIVVQYPSGRSSQESQVLQSKIDDIVKYMTSKKCRVIPEPEIGLAVLYVSLEKYCNPSFSFASVISKKQDETNFGMGINAQILAPETQDIETSESFGSSSRSSFLKRVDETLASDRSGTIRTEVVPCSSTSSLSSFNVKNELSVKMKSNDSTSPSEPKEIDKTKYKTSRSVETPAEDALFHFVQEESAPTSTKSEERFELTIQSGKRKRRLDSESKEDDLFNFVPDNEKPKNKNVRLAPPSPVKLNIEEDKILNLARNTKRKHDGLDTPDGKRQNFGMKNASGCSETKSTIQNSTITIKFDPDNCEWTCKKRLTGQWIVKEESDLESSTSGTSAENELSAKLKEIDLKPAIVIINNNLIVQKDTRENQTTVNISCVNGKKNFKKFIKVQPRKENREIISNDMLVVFEAKTEKSLLNKFMASSSDDDDDDVMELASIPTGKQKNNKAKSRRL